MRFVVGYLIIKTILLKSIQPLEIRTRQLIQSKRFRNTALLLIGTPVYSFIVLFFSKSIEGFYPVSLFMMLLVLDIVRTLGMILIIPNPIMGSIPRSTALYYVIVGVML